MMQRMTSEEKKEFVRGCLQGQIFTSSMIPDHDWVNMVPRVFMPIAFGCLQVSVPEPEIPEEIPEDMSVDEFDRLQADKEDILDRHRELKKKLQKEIDDQIGVVWEWYSESLPRSINGYPIFMSCRIMHKEDWEEVLPILQEKQRQIDDIDL
tara:strand:+ start:8298 stop:8753 length:456 start_codon:yes stop_codon:yes gene_type:complete